MTRLHRAPPLHRTLLLASIVMVSALAMGRAPAKDTLIGIEGMRTGTLEGYSGGVCAFEGDRVPRGRIHFIGLDAEPPVPAPQDPRRDEVHLRDGSIHPGPLVSIDATRVVTPTVNLPRKQVAWIWLAPVPGGQGQAAPPSNRSDGQSAREEEKAPDDRADAWRVPERIFIWTPRRCPTCTDTLHVLDLATNDGAVYLTKKRTVEIDDFGVSANWNSYDPPPRLFPGMIATEDFAEEFDARTWLTTHSYLERRDRAASGGTGGAGQAGGRGRRQYGETTGLADYGQLLRMTNWRIVADDRIRNGLTEDRERYRRLREIPLYDVEVDLRFSWRDYIARGRDVNSDGYTTDYETGPRRTVGPGQPAQDVYEPMPAPQSAAPAGPIDRVLGDPAARLRERAEEWARQRLSEPGPRQGDTSGNRAVPATAGPAHSVYLDMRWYRDAGRVTLQNASDILADVLDGQIQFTDVTVSATLPAGAFDMETPPSWPPANPRPPPRLPNFNFQP